MYAIDPELAATVVAIVDGGSLDAAARSLQMTPSAVSQRLKTLERRLGQVLLVRSRPVRPTAAGETVIRLARQVSLLEHDARQALGVEGAEEVSVPLAVNADSMATWFLPPLARLSRRLGARFDLHREDQNATARLLESGEVMAAVTSESVPVAGCTAAMLGILEYRAVAASDFVDEWFGAGVSAQCLARAPFVDFDRQDGLQHAWLLQNGVDPTSVPRHYVPASHDFAQAVAAGLGWGMLPVLQLDVGDGLIAIGEPTMRVPLYWQQWDLRSELLDAIADEISAEAARVLVQPAGGASSG